MNKENFRILIVDDEKSFLLLMTKILEGEGYTVKGRSDPEDALKVLDSFGPNLIISDLKMPKMDGIRFMEEVRKKQRSRFHHGYCICYCRDSGHSNEKRRCGLHYQAPQRPGSA